MPLLLAIILIACVAVVFLRRPKPVQPRNKCVWRHTGRDDERPSAWQCVTCEAEAFTFDEKAPKDCKKGLTGGKL